MKIAKLIIGIGQHRYSRWLTNVNSGVNFLVSVFELFEIHILLLLK